MYHERFKGNHYEIGFRWGSRLAQHGNFILENIGYPVTKERIAFALDCVPVYQEYFPEILEETRGVADGQNCDLSALQAFLFSMYAMPPACCCSCFAVSNETEILFGRNSDFLTALEKVNQNVIYWFSESSYSFTGNTTAFIQMEDGVNEHGLAVGLTAVYPHTIRAGMNAGLLLRFFLEKCRTVDEVMKQLSRLPVGSAQTFTVADADGNIAVLECNMERLEVIRPSQTQPYVCATNLFHGAQMQEFSNMDIDNWEAETRYQTMKQALERKAPAMGLKNAARLLSGKDGFLCQYDRSTGKDTVWSVIYDLKRRKIFRAEGNPGRRRFQEDLRF